MELVVRKKKYMEEKVVEVGPKKNEETETFMKTKQSFPNSYLQFLKGKKGFVKVGWSKSCTWLGKYQEGMEKIGKQRTSQKTCSRREKKSGGEFEEKYEDQQIDFGLDKEK